MAAAHTPKKTRKTLIFILYILLHFAGSEAKGKAHGASKTPQNDLFKKVQEPVSFYGSHDPHMTRPHSRLKTTGPRAR